MKKNDRQYDSPVIIISAARSGSKMLRSALAASADLIDFPYDMNYVWKYGNYSIKHDELKKENLSENIKKYIHKQFKRRLLNSSAQWVIEKSVPNSLRVEFVKAVFPNCKIIHLYRDGRDVALSAMHCWQAGASSGRVQSKKDLIRKIATFPYWSARSYLIDYAACYVDKIVSSDRHVQTWGPRFDGMDKALKEYSLLEVCGMQWANCVRSTTVELDKMVLGEDYISIRYEDLIVNPVKELKGAADFIGILDYESIKSYALNNITQTRVGLWKKELTHDEIAALERTMRGSLQNLGYEL